MTAAAVGRFASPQRYTPPRLAEKIRTGRPDLEGERKLVTVLFADVAGFTALSEQLDPEDCHDVMRRAFDLMLEEVHRYEGTVSQFLGDGILALFGAPIAHEDHAQRAVRAGLGIQRALTAYRSELHERGLEFRLRVGINSGPVVVDTIGTDLHMTYTAIGDTVNLASRLQALAEPGSVVISRPTRRLVEGHFELRDLGEHRLKGKELPVAAFAVLRPNRWRSRVDLAAEASRGLSPFVGRERRHILRTLLDQFTLAAEGSGQVVLLRGEPGIGKTRLLYELKRELEGRPLTWLEGRCIAYGRDTPYLPVIELVRDRFEISEADAEPTIISRVEAGARHASDGVAAGVPFLKYLLAVNPGDSAVVSMDPQLRKAHVFEALRDLAVAASAAHPLVVVIEDLHWLDPVSEEFLSYLAEAVASHRILLLATFRPEYEHRFGARSNHTVIELHRLSDGETAAMASGVLGVHSLPRDLPLLIERKSDGNPFFVEEVTTSLLEIGALRRSGDGYVLAQPIEAIDVPDTVQGVIMARLDRLPEEPKRAMQTASVIGREFTVRLLDRIAELGSQLEDHLRDLKAVELISERALYPELAYMFKHALTHDVAYRSLLVARRRSLHRQVGEAIEELYADRLAEHYETLAHHYSEAGARAKALDFLARSGDKALAAFAPHQAVSFYDRALALINSAGKTVAADRALELHVGRGQALFLVGDWTGSAAAYLAARQLAAQAGDHDREASSLFHTAFAQTLGHRFEEALAHAEEARALAVAIDNRDVQAGSLVVEAYVRAVTSDPGSSRTTAASALIKSRLARAPRLQGHSLLLLGMIDHWRGDGALALQSLAEGMAIGREHQLPDLLVNVLWANGLACAGCGQYDRSIAFLTEGMALSKRVGARVYWCRSLNSLGWVYMDLCCWDLAIELNREGAAAARDVGDPEIIRNAELNLGDCCLALGRLADAQRYYEVVRRESQRRDGWGEEWMKWRYTQHLDASLADFWHASGDSDRAIGFADACIVAAERTNSRRNIVKGRRARGKALRALGRLDAADVEFTLALRVAREVGNPAQLWKTQAARAALRSAQERRHEAAEDYRAAISTINGVAANLTDATLRDTLLGSRELAELHTALALMSTS